MKPPAIFATLAMLTITAHDAFAQQDKPAPLPEAERVLSEALKAMAKPQMSPFLLSARSGQIEKLRQEISEGADLDQRSGHGWTALMFAAWKGHGEAVELLLDAGANPNLVSSRVAKNTQAPLPETTALAEALGNNHLEIARQLLKRGAQADPVSVAIAGGLDDLSFLKTMHAAGARLSGNFGNIYHDSAMSGACSNGKIENVKWLIEKGVQPELGDLKTAVGHSRADLVQFLVLHGEEKNRFTEQDLSEAFVFAASKWTSESEMERNLSIVQFLLAHGADKNYQPDKGVVQNRTALDFLKWKRAQTAERIERNPYGEKRQASDREQLKQTEALMEIIE